MNKLQTTTSMKIRRHQLDEFKRIAAEMLLVTEERDTGTLQYDWFLNSDHTICVIRETYESSAALLDHIAHLDNALGKRPFRLLAYDHKAQGFGNPSAKLLEVTQGAAVKWYSFLQGLR